MNPLSKSCVVGRKRYNTDTATLLASDCYWDGSNWERHGRNRFLYRTPNGAYFMHFRTQWQGEDDGRIEAVEEDDAVELYGGLHEHEVEFEVAFPTVEIVEA